MKKIILLLFFIISILVFGKDEDIYNIKISHQKSNVGNVTQYSTISPSNSDNDNYFFTLNRNKIYLDSFLVKVSHQEEEHSKQFYNYFVLRVKKSQEQEKTIIEKIFKEDENENTGIFIFSCYEKISETEYTPLYFNIFYRVGKDVSIFRLAKKEDVINLYNYLKENKILDKNEEKYINLCKIF